LNNQPTSHLNPSPSDYARTIFSDRATIHIHAGGGGHGCISFLKEKYISAGPANGGDGGYGGSVYIQAVRGETSLHKLARRNIIKAGRGKNGQGKTKGGERGSDVIVQVPVGTVIREVERIDPVAMEELKFQLEGGLEESVDGFGDVEEGAEGEAQAKAPPQRHKGPFKWSKEKWLLYPAITPEDIATSDFPSFPRARRSHLASAQEAAPIDLDLSRPMEKPILLAAGAVGGLGNPHFVSKTAPRPKFATKGEEGMRITLELELKLLADVGLVGLPNAGKSTLLRAISNSRARVGNWAFTTLQPNIGTVVLDNHTGRPETVASYETGELRTNYTIADIPGLVKDAHLDKGLGISFLRHVERARVLAFVIDLNAGDAVEALKSLWREVGMYERMKIQEEADNRSKEAVVSWSPLAPSGEEHSIIGGTRYHDSVPKSETALSIAAKPWFVVASKADLEGTQENYVKLREYLKEVSKGKQEHPSAQKDGYVRDLAALPISALNGHGVEGITKLVVGMLNA
jgi:GTP-binding protein